MRGIGLQSNGKIIVGCYNFTVGFGTQYAKIHLLRLNTDSSIDSTFGNNGLVIFDSIGTPRDGLTSLAIQQDDKIVIVGNRFITTSNKGGIVARLNADGTIDCTFAIQGVYYQASAISAQSLSFIDVLVKLNGQIVFVAMIDFGKDLMTNLYIIATTLNCLSSNGFIDPSIAFGTPMIEEARPKSLTTDSAGNFYISCNNRNYDLDPFAGMVIKLQPNGSPDLSFGNNGYLYTNNLSYPKIYFNDIKYSSFSNSLYTAGYSFPQSYFLSPMICKINTNGLIDSSYGVNGVASFALSPGYHRFNSLCIPQNGNMIGVGNTDINFQPQDILLGSFDYSGNPDNTFGTAGMVQTPYGSPSHINSLASILQTDGKLLVTGNIDSATFYCARYFTGQSTNTNTIENNSVFSVAPNPTTTYFNLNVREENAALIITSTDGKVVLNKTLASTKNQIDIITFAKGIYFGRVNYKNGESKVFKVVKE